MFNDTSDVSENSNENAWMTLFQVLTVFTVSTVFMGYCFGSQKTKESEEEYLTLNTINIDQSTEFLDLLTEKCTLLKKINEYEETINELLEQQLESGDLGINQEDFLTVNDDLQGLYNQLVQLDKEVVVEGPMQPNTLDSLNDITTTLNDLLKKNEEITLVGIGIKERQEIQISEKNNEIERLKKQLQLATNWSGSFFDNNNHSKDSSFDRKSLDFFKK